jgi:hypothetical protein
MAVMIGAVATAAPRAQEPVVAVKQVAEREAVEALKEKIQNVRVSVESRVTKNAPYSAEAVTESVQTLADGNRIVTKHATRIYRDSEGRTRREQLNPAGTDVVTINISDPVAGTTYVLDPGTHVAYRNGMFFTMADGMATGFAVARTAGAMTVAPGGEPGVMIARKVAPEAETGAEKKLLDEKKAMDEMQVRVLASEGRGGAVGSGGAVTFVAGGMYPARVAQTPAVKEELGQQMIEGVNAVGTRSTTEIPAGTIGNDQPIKVVSEQWYSPELQVLVLTKHNDPRSGETTYRLNNIVRAEQVRSQFELPPDYTLKESMIRREQR